MNKYLQFFRIGLQNSWEYRVELLAKLLLQAIAVFSVILLWQAIFLEQDSVAGLSADKTIQYFLWLPFIGFITQIDISHNLAKEIRDGEISGRLMKPYSLPLATLPTAAAQKLSNLIIVSPIYLVVAWLLQLVVEPMDILLMLVIGLLAFLLHWLLDLTISWAAFWITDVWSFRHLKSIAFSILGGLSFPLAFAGPELQQIMNFLPFKYFYYVPTSYLLGERQLNTYLGSDLLGIGLWSLIIFILARYLWLAGRKRYEAFGG